MKEYFFRMRYRNARGDRWKYFSTRELAAAAYKQYPERVWQQRNYSPLKQKFHWVELEIIL